MIPLSEALLLERRKEEGKKREKEERGGVGGDLVLGGGCDEVMCCTLFGDSVSSASCDGDCGEKGDGDLGPEREE